METSVDYGKIVVAHPGRQHSFYLAEALESHGMLSKYITTVYDKESSFLMKVAKRILRGNDLERTKHRHMQSVPDSKVVLFYELRGFILLFLYQKDKSNKLAYRYERFLSKKFQKKVAKYLIKNNYGVVISYDTNSELLFSILKRKKPEIIRIMDNAHPNRFYLHKIYNDNDSEDVTKRFSVTYGKEPFLLDEDLARSFCDEAQTADAHLVASSFSKQAVAYCGFDKSRIKVIPYGVKPSFVYEGKKDYSHGLIIVFVGAVNQRKGIGQLCEAAKALSEYDIEFNVVGSGKNFHEELYAPYEQYLNFKGRVSDDELQQIYREGHVFVFPTMGEGYGLVLIEAMASGLPVIVSRNCGGPDMVEEGKNGFLIDAGSTLQLMDKIKYVYEHIDILPEMSKEALRTAKLMTWERYGEGIIKSVSELIGDLSKEKHLKVSGVPSDN